MEEEITNSMKILVIVLMSIILIPILFLIGIVVVNAETNYNQSVEINMNESSNNLNRIIWNDPNHTSKIFAGVGRGTLVTIILTDRYSETTSFELPTLYSVNARTDSGYSTCEVSSLSNDTNANTQMKASMYGVKCDLTIGANGLISLSANFDPQVNNNWNMRVYRITFNNNLQAQEVAYEQYVYQYLQDWIYPRLNDIKNNTGTISATEQAIYNYLVDWIYPRVNEIKQAILNTQQAVINGNTQAHNDHEEIMGSDIDSTDKEQPNKDDYDSYKDKEDTIMSITEEADTSSLNIGMDTTTNNFIWNLMTRLINTHSLVYGLFIAILSIGVIKLVLAR